MSKKVSFLCSPFTFAGIDNETFIQWALQDGSQAVSGLEVAIECIILPGSTLCSNPCFFSSVECSVVPSLDPASENSLERQSAGGGDTR